MNTPFEDGYRAPAEWEPHEATWLTYPHSDDSFPGKLSRVYPPYFRFIDEISKSEKVRINVPAEFSERFARQTDEAGIDRARVEIFLRESDDVWCRDHGPAFLIKDAPGPQPRKAVVDWEFNAWGGKYPHARDNRIAGGIAADFELPVYRPGIVMEGGAVDFNGAGTLLTTGACLLHPNRNPTLNRRQIEQYLHDYYCVSQILWLGDGIAGDDTDGHVDDVTRFVSIDTVVTAAETNKNDVNYRPLRENLQALQTMRLADGRQLNIAELPMPDPVICDGRRLPASYANFCFTNDAVIVPTFRCRQDDEAIRILASCIPGRRIVGIDSTDIVWGLGSFHCLSRQEPVERGDEGKQSGH